jgi:hypothetical protein
VHVVHLPRMSTEQAKLADRLSRSSTTRWGDRAAIRRALQPEVRGPLLEWLQRPRDDWDLPLRLLRAVQDTLRRVNQAHA